jgi:4-hydroxy-3-methylbut-2-enyl diphosphate reductase
MRILKAERAGFCFGVKRAIDMAFKVADECSNGVVTLGPIIHNPQMIEKLEEAGIKYIDNVSDLDDLEGVRTVIIRTHGVPLKDIESLEHKGVEVVDATCPFVKKAQDYARFLSDNEYKVVILGDREHPEVKGIMSYAGKDVVVVKEASEYKPLSGRIGIIVQTTKHMDDLKDLLSVAIYGAKELRVFNTICSSTDLKLNETEELSSQVDIMLVVGGRNSANTTRVANLSRSLSVPTHHIETASEVKEVWFTDVNTVGVTAGASTPDWIIDEVINRLKDIGG